MSIVGDIVHGVGNTLSGALGSLGQSDVAEAIGLRGVKKHKNFVENSFGLHGLKPLRNSLGTTAKMAADVLVGGELLGALGFEGASTGLLNGLFEGGAGLGDFGSFGFGELGATPSVSSGAAGAGTGELAELTAEWVPSFETGFIGDASTGTGMLDATTAASISDIPQIGNVGGIMGGLQAGMQGLGILGNLGALTTGIQQRNAGKIASREAAQRQQFARRLQDLEANPSLVTSTPGYQAGLEAIQRTMAAQGYMGSGNMMAEMAKYGQNAYDKRFQELSSLATGAGTLAASGAATKAGGTGRAVLGAAGLGSNIYNLMRMWG